MLLEKLIKRTIYIKNGNLLQKMTKNNKIAMI